MSGSAFPSAGRFRAALETLERSELDLAPFELPAAIGRLEALQARLLAEMVRPEATGRAPREIAASGRPQSANEAAERAGVPSARVSFRVEEAAEALGVSVGHVRNEIARGNLPVARLGRAVVIPADELCRYLGRRIEQPQNRL